MKRTDLSPERQELLVPLKSHPGAFGLVPPPIPRFIPLPGLKGEVIRAHEALGALQLATARLPNPNLVTRTLDRREAVRSSQIEGTASDVDDLLAYEATGSDEGLPPDVVVTMNYVKALEFGLKQVAENGVGALNKKLIKDLHRHLMNGAETYRGVPGEFRTTQNWIGAYRIYDAKFVPPPPDRVEDCIDDLIPMFGYVPDEEDQYELSVVTRMAIVHAQFETIHPFIDGNGRVGRIMLPLMMAAEGYPPIYLAGFLKANQEIYYETLRAVQLRGEWAEWVRFFAAGVDNSCRESIRTADRLAEILEEWKRKVGSLKLRSDAATHRLPDVLIGSPVVTVNLVEKVLGVAFPNANRALEHLQALGIVAPLREEQKRNRTFVAREVIEVLNQPSSP